MEIFNILVIGAVAAGTKAASKAKRENPDAKVTVITKDNNISYAGCGLPYFIGDVIKEKEELLVRHPGDFKEEQDIDVFTGIEATKIDRKNKKVYAKNLKTNEELIYKYDKLILATGASPFIPPIVGVNLENVFTLRTASDAIKLKSIIDGVKKAVVVGGGFIGLEVAENLKKRGIDVSIVEMAETILPGFDREIAMLVQNHLAENDVRIYTGEAVKAIKGDKKVSGVLTSKRILDADIVILSIGVRPNSKIAADAGLEIGSTGAIKVDEYMRTSDPDIYAVGDCAESTNLITGKPAWYPMGSTANKTGRIAGINLFDEIGDNLRGVLGTTVVKLFDINAARTGLSEAEALKLGYEIETAIVPANDKAHYYPGYRMIITKLIADKKTHKILGAQIVGEGVVDKPIDIIATAITFGGKVEDLEKLDLAYAPPFSMAMASTIVAANVLKNKLTNRLKGISPIKLHERLNDGNLTIIDTRTEPEYIIGTIPGAINIPFVDLIKDKYNNLDKNKTTVLLCKVGKRAYMAYRELQNKGFKDLYILDGGISAYPFELE